MNTAGPAVRLALSGVGSIEKRALSSTERKPRLLVSFVYLSSFMKHRESLHFDDWVLDSGAFSAHNSGRLISLKEYIDLCKRLIDTDDRLAEIYALDVINDWRGSLRNCEAMWKAGIPAIPAYHIGEPEHALRSIARDYPKIALGGMALLKGKNKEKWPSQCMARVWPKKVHAFAVGNESLVLRVPFHSIDATSWAMQPQRYGLYKMWGKGIPVRGQKIDIRGNVQHYMDLQKQAEERWSKEMAMLESIEPTKTLRQQARELA